MYYFAYGSNLHKEQMLQRCPDSVPVARVKLPGYQLVFKRVADIVEKEAAVTWGAIYEVSSQDIRHLDAYEGYPNLYTKIPVIAEDDQGRIYKAFAYELVAKGEAEPTSSYYNIIKTGYIDWNISLKPLREALKRSQLSAPVGLSGVLWPK